MGGPGSGRRKGSKNKNSNITMTKAQWNKTHKDYKGITNGKKGVLKLVNGKTTIVPVKIKG